VTSPVVSPLAVPASDLKIGGLLAEGGEGQVHVLPRQPHLVYKSYRRPGDRSHLEELVAWPDTLTPAAAGIVRAASAWPCSVVAGADGTAEGLLVPRAPRRFAVRHRDGHSRLASLSYLTADPEHRAVAYGLQLPEAVTAERVGLVYALARLLAAFESGEPAVVHGDLSTKNVLWSLQRGPEAFVIDCDSCARYGPDGEEVDALGRRRAMTPNWDDPAVGRGANPGPATDRYSLALVFLRVVGAANFPIQARQRGGGPVEVRFPVPIGPSTEPLLDPDAAIWRLCGSALSLESADRRPAAADWLGPLEDLLGLMGAPEVVASVWAAQGGEGRSAPGPIADPPGDIRIVPERAPQRARTWTRVAPVPRYGPRPASGPAIGYRSGAVGSPAPAPAGPTPAAKGQVSLQLRRYLDWWVSIHRTLARSLRASKRGPTPVRTALLCAAVDFATVVLVAAAVALVISPLIGP
jgi:hypothetical protein